jgi:SAM-dependent methyltransferase
MSDVFADIAKNQLLAIPPVRRWQQDRRREGDLAEHESADPGYARDLHSYLARDLARFHPLTGELLEIGPGGTLGVAALFVKHGMSRATCIDVVPWETVDDGYYRELGVVDELARVDYRWPVPVEDSGLPDAAFDVVVSYACFEHFSDPGKAVAEIARMLKPGGVTGHVIDMRDHRDFGRPLDFLRYPNWLWRLMVSRRPFATNRWRLSDYRQTFETAGLEIVDVRVTTHATVAAEDVRRFRPRFRRKTTEDLAAVVAWIAAVKPAS